MPKLKKSIDPTAQPIHCPGCHSNNSFKHNEKKDRYLEDSQGNKRVGWKGFVCEVCGYTTLTPFQDLTESKSKGI